MLKLFRKLIVSVPIISFFIFSMLSSCGGNFIIREKDKRADNDLVGTWQIIEFTNLDTTTNTWMYPFGKKVRGYFTYTSSNIVNLNISSEVPLSVGPDSLDVIKYSYRNLLNNALGYFGDYTIDFENSVVTHHVKGGSIPWYIGTDQPRPFSLSGDTLIIGDNKRWKRVLVRVN